MKPFLIVLPGFILFLLGIIGGIVIFRPIQSPLKTQQKQYERLPSPLPSVSFIPSKTLRIPGTITTGTLSYQPVDGESASTISGALVLRQGDSIATRKDSAARFSADGLSISMSESTALGASSLLPTSLLFTLSDGGIAVTTAVPVSFRAGISLIRMASTSATLTYTPGESISLSVSQGSASAAFVDATNETQVYDVSKGKTLIIDQQTQTARVK